MVVKANKVEKLSEDYFGYELADDVDFFVEPPEEIGEIVGGYTNCRKHHKPLSPSKRKSKILLGTVSGFLIGLVINTFLNVVISLFSYGNIRFNPLISLVLIIVFVVIGFISGYESSFFNKECRYIGKKGIACFEAKNSREDITYNMIIPFADLTALRILEKKNCLYSTFNYTAENIIFDYKWYNEKDIEYSISGEYKSNKHKKRVSPNSSHFSDYNNHVFASLAQKQWTNYFLKDRINNNLSNKDFIEFDVMEQGVLGLSDYSIKYKNRIKFIKDIYEVEFRDGILKFYFQKEEESNLEERYDEYAVKVNDTVVLIEEKDNEKNIKERYSSNEIKFRESSSEEDKDTFKIDIAKLLNPLVFFNLLEQRTGIAVELLDVDENFSKIKEKDTKKDSL